jgi:hypothetical protein
MVVDQFHVKGIILFKTENDAPIGPHRYGPQALQIALQRVQTIAGEIQRFGVVAESRTARIRSTVFKRSGLIPLRSPRS